MFLNLMNHLHADRLIRAGTNQECIQYTTPTEYDGLAWTTLPMLTTHLLFLQLGKII